MILSATTRLPAAALPGSRDFHWMLKTPDGVRKLEVRGPFDSDDGDVLTGWALAGRGIINKPRFEVEPFIRDQRLAIVLPENPPNSVQLAALYPHKKFQTRRSACSSITCRSAASG